MVIADDLQNNSSTTFSSKLTARDGRTVPEPKNLKQLNDAVHFERASILYADLDGRGV